MQNPQTLKPEAEDEELRVGEGGARVLDDGEHRAAHTEWHKSSSVHSLSTSGATGIIPTVPVLYLYQIMMMLPKTRKPGTGRRLPYVPLLVQRW